MSKQAKVVATLLGLMFVLSAFGSPSAMAQQTTCDPAGSVNGTATPPYINTGQSTVLVGTGFTPGEAVSYWITLPNGDVVGTAAPVPDGVNPDGTVGVRVTMTEQAAALGGPGRWAITFQGAGSNRTAIIYFCVNSVPPAQPTATVPAPTATSVPATATTAGTSPTAGVTETAVASPTGGAASPTAAASPTMAATAAASPTPAESPMPPGPTASLMAGDQVITDNSVMVDSVTATQNGWVVIHEANPDGTLKGAPVIGKVQVNAGTTTNLRIPLDRPAVNGETLWPMLHIDAGTIGTYEFPGADVPVTANGQVVMMEIMVTVVGMPRTGAATDMTLLFVATLTAMGLLTVGVMARRRTYMR